MEAENARIATPIAKAAPTWTQFFVPECHCAPIRSNKQTKATGSVKTIKFTEGNTDPGMIHSRLIKAKSVANTASAKLRQINLQDSNKFINYVVISNTMTEVR